jgi:hypothetical protein
VTSTRCRLSRHATSGPSREDDWYRIRIQGHVDQRWISWFDGLALTRDGDGTTLLQGPVADQAALHGLLTKVRDMGLPLVSVTREGRPESPSNEGATRTNHENLAR